MNAGGEFEIEKGREPPRRFPTLTDIRFSSGTMFSKRRDELGISEKARFDGEYVAALNAGHGRGFAMDCKCFVGTVGSVIRHKGVIENGTCDSRDEAAAEKETVGK